MAGCGRSGRFWKVELLPYNRPTTRRTRGLWARTNHANGGFKDNTPGGWVDTSGPVWWVGSDRDRGWLSPMPYGGGPVGFSAITRATNLIVNRLAASSWTVDGAAPRWLSDPMLTRPDDRFLPSMYPAPVRLPRTVFWGQWIRSALSWGAGYVMFVPDDSGTPLAGSLRLLRPDHVTVGHDRENPAARRVGAPHGGDGFDVDAEGMFTAAGVRLRLLELPNPTTPADPETGCAAGTLTYHAAELGLLDAINEYTAGTYQGSGVPSGYLKVEGPAITQAQADGLKSSWMAAHGSGSRGVAVLNAATSYQPIAASPVDTALADMKKLSLLDVANAYGVPPYLLGAPSGNSATYSNVQMEAESLWTHTLYVWAAVISDVLGSLLPAGRVLRIDDPLTAGTDPSRQAPAPAVGMEGDSDD